jgi:dTDP-4-dehydrorhamnose reductase
MRILVTGAAGQLGRELVQVLGAQGLEVTGIDRRSVDFAKPECVAGGIAAHRADWVINCAAYTQVDRAETEQALAFAVNRDSARAVAEGVARGGGRLVHISTDFVFAGEQSHPYKEDDAGGPLGVYGRSKWEGEQAVREVMPDAVVLRTAWVYGVHGQNFVKTILRLAGEHDELAVVDDQIGTPSWSADIARAIVSLTDVGASGIFHFTNEGVASWYDFAQEIVAQARELGVPVRARRVRPIPTTAYPTLARRPAYAVLSKEKIRAVVDYDIPHWKESLHAMLGHWSSALVAARG